MNSAVHVLVMQLVCCPANSSAMRSPVTCSSVMSVPSLYLVSMNMVKMSVPSECLTFGLSLLFLMTFPNSSTIFSRAAFLALWAAVGAFGKKTVRGVRPLSRSWYSSLTSLKRFSRTSSPWRHRDEVSIVSSLRAWKRSIVPGFPPQCSAKYCLVSLSIFAVYPLRRAVRNPCAMDWNCTCRFFLEAS